MFGELSIFLCAPDSSLYLSFERRVGCQHRGPGWVDPTSLRNAGNAQLSQSEFGRLYGGIYLDNGLHTASLDAGVKMCVAAVLEMWRCWWEARAPRLLWYTTTLTESTRLDLGLPVPCVWSPTLTPAPAHSQSGTTTCNQGTN